MDMSYFSGGHGLRRDSPPNSSMRPVWVFILVQNSLFIFFESDDDYRTKRNRVVGDAIRVDVLRGRLGVRTCSDGKVCFYAAKIEKNQVI
jgi:hypothetical protein